MTIYTEFQPTYLYIKQHSVTGKLYFGKTIKKLETYNGSGKLWVRHLNKHGKDHVETLWFCLFYEKAELTKFASMCSEQWNIVESKDWLNLILENGLDGGATNKGKKRSLEAIEKNRLTSTGKKHSPDRAEKARLFKQSPEFREKMRILSTGRKMSPEDTNRKRITQTGKTRGPYKKK